MAGTGEGSGARRRWARRILILFGALAATGAALLVAAALLLDSGAVVAKVRRDVLPQVSERLGRKVDFDSAKIGFFPPRVDLAGLTIGGRPGEPPLVETKRTRASVALWPLVRSLGKDVQFRSVQLDEPRINLVRSRDGTWNSELPPTEPSQRKYTVSELRVRSGELRVIDRSSDPPGEAVTLKRIDVTASNLGATSPARVAMAAALGSPDQNLEMKGRFNPKDQALTGSFSADPLDVAALRDLLPGGLGDAVTGGTLAMESDIATEQGAYVVKGRVDARSLALRNGEARGGFDLTARAPKGSLSDAVVNLENIALQGPGVDLKGSAGIRGTSHATFDLGGSLLDLDSILAALPQRPATRREDEGKMVPEASRERIRGLSAKGRIAVDRLVVKKLATEDFKGAATLQDGVLTFNRATARFYAGNLSATGTRIDLRQAAPEWELHAGLENVDLGQAFQALAPATPLQGKFTGKLDLRGSGSVWEQVRRNMTGTGSFTLVDGSFLAADLGQAISEPVANALRVAGAAVNLGRGGSGGASTGKTNLPKLAGTFSVQNGWMSFTRPLDAVTDFGGMGLNGALALDGRIDLDGTATLAPQFLSQSIGFAPGAPMEVPISLGGALTAPNVQVNTRDVVKGLVKPPTSPEDLLRKRLPKIFKN